MLTAIGIVDSHPSALIKFEIHEVQPHLPYHVAFLVNVECMNNTIKHPVVDEGVAASVMCLTCWKGLGSPTLSNSMNMLTSFDGTSFRLHGILPSLKVQLGGKTMSIEIEVAVAPLDNNLLLGCNYIYNMREFMSSLL